MVFLFGLPYLVAFYFYFGTDKFTLDKTNYGTIISPARAIPDVELIKPDNSKFRLSSLKGKWVLASIGNSDCKQDCIDNLYKIRQIKKAVGQEYKRITKLFFLKDKNNIESFEKLLKEYPGMDVIMPSGNDYNNHLSNFFYENKEVENGIFIIDPLGNYMMFYPKGADASKILKDVQRLLRVSKVG
ncbi:MAG: SCO family protein [Gammaproteobacteria bacterium]|nr:SCO family protein [Gammaproteobacteria bacterium]